MSKGIHLDKESEKLMINSLILASFRRQSSGRPPLSLSDPLLKTIIEIFLSLKRHLTRIVPMPCTSISDIISLYLALVPICPLSDNKMSSISLISELSSEPKLTVSSRVHIGSQ